MSNWDFALAIDLGNSRVVAAVARVTQSAQTETMVFSSGDDEHSMASAVFVDADGSLHFADEAERLGAEHPERLVREFANRIGDDVPVMVGEHAIPAEDLYAGMCAWIVQAATAREEAPPSAVAVTVPTGWGGHRRALIAAALERAGIPDVILLSEAEAAARHYEVANPLEPGQMVGLYDLGGTSFDALILRKRIAAGVGSQPIGEQIRLDLGGADFDELLLRQVMATADPVALRTGDEDMIDAVAGLRREVAKAKETLSSEADATLSIESDSGSFTVRITRSEFEALIDDPLERTLDAFDLAVESAGIDVDRLEAIVLTGGSSRIPLVAQRLSERFNRPIVAADDPRTTVALGAALIAADRMPGALAPHAALVLAGDATASDEAQVASSDGTSNDRLKIARPATERSWWPKSPILLTTAAAFIAFAIVFSNTTAAGSRWPDYVQVMADEAATVVDPLILRDFASTPDSADAAAEQVASVQPKAQADRENRSDRSTTRERNVTRDTMPVSRSHGITTPDVSADAPRQTASKPTPKSTTKTPSTSSGPIATPTAPADAPMPVVDPEPVTTPTPETPPADPAPAADPPPPADPAPPADPTPADPAPSDPVPSDPPPAAPPEDPAPPADPPADPAPASTEAPAGPTPAEPADPTP